MRAGGYIGANLNERAVLQTGTDPGVITPPATIETSSINAPFFDARLLAVVMTIGLPIVGSPTVKARWQDSGDGILWSTIAEGPVIALSSGMYVARLDTAFLRSPFVRLQMDFTGPGDSFPMSAHWLMQDIQQSKPRPYEAFPVLEPQELVVVDTTMKGDN